MIRPAVFATVALLLSGCATLTSSSRFEPLDRAAAIGVEDPRVVFLAGALATTAGWRHSLVGAARVRLEAPKLSFSRPQRIAVMRPASLRVEILGLLDQVVAVLATDGTRYHFFDASKPGIEEGELESGLLWQVARIDLEPEEAVSLLLGAPLDPSSVLESAGSLDDGALLLAFRSAKDGSRRVFDFDGSGRLARVRQRAADGLLVWEARYSDYRARGESVFAHGIEIDFPAQGARASFHFRTAELNRDLSSRAFVLEEASR